MGQSSQLSHDTLNRHPFEAVAIGASLGGPMALATILQDIPASFPIPIFVVQHITPSFAHGLAKWLQDYTSLHVTMGEHGQIAEPGNCYIAPPHCHMEVKAGHVITLTHSPTDLLQPSVAHLFKSMATTYGPKAIGVILTGMGHDGVEELLLMKNKGAHTIAQSKEGCVMYGMPQEALATGAAKQAVPLKAIAQTLIGLVETTQAISSPKTDGGRL